MHVGRKLDGGGARVPPPDYCLSYDLNVADCRLFQTLQRHVPRSAHATTQREGRVATTACHCARQQRTRQHQQRAHQ
eukprot:7053281-Prymnesium_polylepis.2